ncbi:MAG: hypothetical protein M1817_004397 [Caeruleum heppii]|nr:MAG: hypothetical protein M1817_004397 [Caeruleum heppii]
MPDNEDSIVRHPQDNQSHQDHAGHAGPSDDRTGPSSEQQTPHKDEGRPSTSSESQKKGSDGPPGGIDSSPLPSCPQGYTLRFTFHSATNLPWADIVSFSSDPFVVAQINTDTPRRHKEDPYLRFRTPTIRRSTEPVWNSTWIVANVPTTGFKLKARIYDEDPADFDDRLGNVHVHADNISESWPGIKEEAFKIKKRMGSKRAYTARGCAAMFSRGVHMDGKLIVSVEVLGKTEGEGGKLYTIGPQYWTQHYSPMIGRLAGTKEPGKEGKTERYNFQANQFQLQGPVPDELYHRYVEFKPFVKGMFSKAGLRGRILNHALHHQHARIYNFDRSTVYGQFSSPSADMTRQFLDMVHWDRGGRIFTYVLALDGHLRFTETGKEYGIDMLSKHTMHSDVSIYIAFSGEFLVRRRKDDDGSSPASPRPPASPQTPATPKSAKRSFCSPCAPNGHPSPTKSHPPPSPPDCYELIIDNDSGTYRCAASLLPALQSYLENNLPTLQIRTFSCDSDELATIKHRQIERKKASGQYRNYAQTDWSDAESESSVSGSEEEELNRVERLGGSSGGGGSGGGAEQREGGGKKGEVRKPRRKSTKGKKGGGGKEGVRNGLRWIQRPGEAAMRWADQGSGGGGGAGGR